MTRRCSHCSHNGHNSRTCPNRGVKIFGVRLTDGSIRKSASMGNLSQYPGSGGGGGAGGEDHAAENGYASEDLAQGSSSSSRDRKKGVPWTEEEHRMFLIGLHKLGKGDWRGISRKYVVSRTPTQVASHAQKYFIRQTTLARRKRRSSLFDMVPDETIDGRSSPMGCPEEDKQNKNQLPNAPGDEECESMDSNTHEQEAATQPQPENLQCTYPAMVFPAYFPHFLPFPLPYWPGCDIESSDKGQYEIIKPTAVHSKAPINVDELVGMLNLSLGESNGKATPSPSLMLGSSNRQSAFHTSLPSRGSSMNSGSNPIHADQI